jgi:hypothetical protein
MFVYPAWIFLPLLPFALVPLRLAIALWTGLLLSGMFHLIGHLAISWGNHQLRYIILWAVALGFGCLPYITIAITKGQLNFVSLGALLLVICLIDNSPSQNTSEPHFMKNSVKKSMEPILRDLSTGFILTLSILKPTLTLIAVIGIVFWALVERRIYFVIGFISSLIILFTVSWLMVGNWIPDYLQLLSIAGGAPILWSLALLPWPWNVLYAAFFTGICIFGFILFLRTRNRVQWFSVSLLVGLAFFPMRWIYDLQLGLLVPAKVNKFTSLSTASVVIALLAPWGFAFLPESIRWPALVIGLPLAWAFVWFAQFVLPVRSKGMK